MYTRGAVDVGTWLGPSPVVYLPHSCHEWEIGGKEEVEMLIEDLQELLKKL